MVSYADMVTLLFACFAALYASSLVQTKNLEQAKAENEIGTRFEQTSPDLISPKVDTEAAGRMALAETIRTAVDHADAVAGVAVREDAHGVVVSLPEAGAFAAGQADLSQAARRVIRSLADVLAKETGEIRVEGHTDNTPIATARFASNWELSAARATEVIRYLVAQGGIAPERLSASGYGEFRPIASNDSPESRARNRRVDIFVLR